MPSLADGDLEFLKGDEGSIYYAYGQGGAIGKHCSKFALVLFATAREEKDRSPR